MYYLKNPKLKKLVFIHINNKSKLRIRLTYKRHLVANTYITLDNWHNQHNSSSGRFCNILEHSRTFWKILYHSAAF